MTPVVQPLIALGGLLGVVTIIYLTYRWFGKPFKHPNDKLGES